MLNNLKIYCLNSELILSISIILFKKLDMDCFVNSDTQWGVASQAHIIDLFLQKKKNILTSTMKRKLEYFLRYENVDCN